MYILEHHDHVSARAFRSRAAKAKDMVDSARLLLLALFPFLRAVLIATPPLLVYEPRLTRHQYSNNTPSGLDFAESPPFYPSPYV